MKKSKVSSSSPSMVSYDKSTTSVVKKAMSKEPSILKREKSKLFPPLSPSSSSSSSFIQTTGTSSGVPFAAYDSCASHLRAVLLFPNVSRAIGLISRSKELQRLELGFYRLKANNKSLLKREILRSRREEKSMYDHEMQRKQNEECQRKATEDAARKSREEEEQRCWQEEEDRRRREEEILSKKHQEERMQELRPQRIEPSVRLIQRCIRGYLGRGLVKDLYRIRLLLHLKIWAHGRTSTLFNRPFVKTAMIDGKDCTIWVDLAVHASRISCRPFKNLFSAKDIRDIIKKIEKIQIEEKSQADLMKGEYKRRMLERENMINADKESKFIQAFENRLLRERGESLAKAKEKERLEQMEEKRRKRVANVRKNNF